jgi:hypothetical protein
MLLQLVSVAGLQIFYISIIVMLFYLRKSSNREFFSGFLDTQKGTISTKKTKQKLVKKQIISKSYCTIIPSCV